MLLSIVHNMAPTSISVPESPEIWNDPPVPCHPRYPFQYRPRHWRSGGLTSSL